MMEPFIGQVMMFAGNFAPRGWAFCNGQLLSISENTALYSILGTTYGGDGRTTFALPDLRGRVPVHPGQGPGLSGYQLGEQGGSETNTLVINNLPPHNHPLLASSSASDDDTASGNVLAKSEVYVSGAANTTMGVTSVGATGEGQPVQNIQPFLCVNAIIALQGIFPSRS